MADLKISGATPNPSPAGTDAFATDKAGVDFQTSLTQIAAFAAVGAGDVFKVGTPLVNQLGVWTGDGTIKGDANWQVVGTSLQGVLGSGPELRNVAGVNIHPRKGDTDTGLASRGDDRLAMVAQGIDGIKLIGAASAVLQQHNTIVGITAFAGGGAGSAVQLNSSYSVVDTVATTGDSVKFSTTLEVGVVNYVKNDGANALDLFPAGGDDLGNGVGVAISVPAGASVAFIGTVTGSVSTQFIFAAGAAGGDVFKVGTPVNNQVGVWTGDGTIEGDTALTFDAGVLNSTRLRAGFGNQSLPSHSFTGETGTGMYRQSAGILGFVMLGLNRWFMRSTHFHANLANGPAMVAEAPSATNPVFAQDFQDLASGLGGISGFPALIGSGVTLAETIAAASGGLRANNTLTGAGLERVLTTADLGSGLSNDAVQARRTTGLTLTTAFVDVTLDATDIESDDTVIEHDGVTDRIVAKVTGTYEIAYEWNLDWVSGTGDLIMGEGRVRVNDASVLNGSDAHCGAFEDTSIDGDIMNNHLSNKFIANLTANDFVTLQVRKVNFLVDSPWSCERASLQVTRIL